MARARRVPRGERAARVDRGRGRARSRATARTAARSSASTRIKLAGREVPFKAVQYELLRREPQVGDGFVRFVQTAGGRMGLPAPRLVRGKPFFRITSSSAWTTLALTIYADGRSERELVGASPFPRHFALRRRGQARRRSRARSTSRRGTASRTAATRRGATRSRRRSSRRSSRSSSARSRNALMQNGATAKRAVALAGRDARRAGRRGRASSSSCSTDVLGRDRRRAGRRARPGRDRRRAGGVRGRRAHRDADGDDAGARGGLRFRRGRPPAARGAGESRREAPPELGRPIVKRRRQCRHASEADALGPCDGYRADAAGAVWRSGRAYGRFRGRRLAGRPACGADRRRSGVVQAGRARRVSRSSTRGCGRSQQRGRSRRLDGGAGRRPSRRRSRPRRAGASSIDRRAAAAASGAAEDAVTESGREGETLRAGRLIQARMTTDAARGPRAVAQRSKEVRAPALDVADTIDGRRAWRRSTRRLWQTAGLHGHRRQGRDHRRRLRGL